MIARPAPLSQPSDWREELRQAFRCPRKLLEWLDIDPADAGILEHARFPMLVPRAYAGRMRAGDLHDPLLRQVLPLGLETRQVPGFSSDPVGDGPAAAGRGLLHKYAGRLLVITTGACAVHCRYCFRREFPYATQHANRQDWAGVIHHVRQNPDITEIILSGGDPLMLETARLAALTGALGQVPTIRRLRIHTRLPVVLPSRVDGALLDWLAGLPWPVTMVLHANHGRELDPQVAAAADQLRSRGVHLLNQAVLLKSINDDAGTLTALMETGFDMGILPYYLHLLDQVSGSAHFQVSTDQARILMRRLREQLPGYLVPRLVREDAGALYKTPVL